VDGVEDDDDLDLILDNMESLSVVLCVFFVFYWMIPIHTFVEVSAADSDAQVADNEDYDGLVLSAVVSFVLLLVLWGLEVVSSILDSLGLVLLVELIPGES